MLQEKGNTFPCFVVEKDMVNMKKPSKKKYLEASWEGPYFFVGYANVKDNVEFDEGGHIYVIKGQDEAHRD